MLGQPGTILSRYAPWGEPGRGVARRTMSASMTFRSAASGARTVWGQSPSCLALAVVRKVSGWPRRCKLDYVFLWEYACKRLYLAQLVGQLGVCFNFRAAFRRRQHLLDLGQDPAPEVVAEEGRGLCTCPQPARQRGQSEKDAKLAQKLGQLQPFIVVFPQECMGQLASFGPT